VYQLVRRHFDGDALSDFAGLSHPDAQSERQRRRSNRWIRPSYPKHRAGLCRNKWGAKNVLLIAFIIFLIGYLGFALTQTVVLIAAFFVLYGLFQGIFRTAGKALVSSFVPDRLRASGIGWYNTTVGVMQLVASRRRALGPRRACGRVLLWGGLCCRWCFGASLIDYGHIAWRNEVVVTNREKN
jgi:MFS family permease